MMMMITKKEKEKRGKQCCHNAHLDVYLVVVVCAQQGKDVRDGASFRSKAEIHRSC